FQLLLGSSWPLADAAFVLAAAALVRLALKRAAAVEEPERERGLWALAALAAWLPGARLASRVGGFPWYSFGSLLLLALWTAAFALGVRELWNRRGSVAPEPARASRAILVLAAWRLIASVLLLSAWGTVSDDLRVVSGFEVFAQLPARLAFAAIFF